MITWVLKGLGCVSPCNTIIPINLSAPIVHKEAIAVLWNRSGHHETEKNHLGSRIWRGIPSTLNLIV